MVLPRGMHKRGQNDEKTPTIANSLNNLAILVTASCLGIATEVITREPGGQRLPLQFQAAKGHYRSKPETAGLLFAIYRYMPAIPLITSFFIH
ncbi:hypothetical protein [Aeromonas sp. 604176]|uniref:hypothetical protein n=1 Tax=Aeromonas sp. 604176 TaxID=2712052 RepID=UPI003BA22909